MQKRDILGNKIALLLLEIGALLGITMTYFTYYSVSLEGNRAINVVLHDFLYGKIFAIACVIVSVLFWLESKGYAAMIVSALLFGFIVYTVVCRLKIAAECIQTAVLEKGVSSEDLVRAAKINADSVHMGVGFWFIFLSVILMVAGSLLQIFLSNMKSD